MSRLLRLDLACECKRTPPLRITLEERQLALTQAPDTQKGTWQCRCGAIVPITAAAYHRAA